MTSWADGLVDASMPTSLRRICTQQLPTQVPCFGQGGPGMLAPIRAVDLITLELWRGKPWEKPTRKRWVSR